MENEFSRIASLIGDPVRSKIMWALLDGRAYTATELANYTETTPQNISMHLTKLVMSDLLCVEKQGRHRYYNYARPEISYAIEALANLIPQANKSIKINLPDQSVRFCRTCYDHLAGKIGVLLTDKLLELKILIKEGADFKVSMQGEIFFATLNIDIHQLSNQKRSFARACLDWSERKPHLAGALGAAMLERMIANNWIRRTANSRAIVVTGKGKEALHAKLGVEI
jgi:DNA-binding transcriptional ArsR family regulator